MGHTFGNFLFNIQYQCLDSKGIVICGLGGCDSPGYLLWSAQPPNACPPAIAPTRQPFLSWALFSVLGPL